MKTPEKPLVVEEPHQPDSSNDGFVPVKKPKSKSKQKEADVEIPGHPSSSAGKAAQQAQQQAKSSGKKAAVVQEKRSNLVGNAWDEAPIEQAKPVLASVKEPEPKLAGQKDFPTLDGGSGSKGQQPAGGPLFIPKAKKHIQSGWGEDEEDIVKQVKEGADFPSLPPS